MNNATEMKLTLEWSNNLVLIFKSITFYTTLQSNVSKCIVNNHIHKLSRPEETNTEISNFTQISISPDCGIDNIHVLILCKWIFITNQLSYQSISHIEPLIAPPPYMQYPKRGMNCWPYFCLKGKTFFFQASRTKVILSSVIHLRSLISMKLDTEIISRL